MSSRCRTSSRSCCPRLPAAPTLPAHRDWREAVDRRPKPAAGAKPAERREAARNAPSGYVVTVTDRTKTLHVEDAAGKVVFHAPVTTGSGNDPLPVGEWKVNGVQRNPTVQLQPGSVLGRQPGAFESQARARPEQPGRRRVDRSHQGALRHPRHARAVAHRLYRIARLHPPDQLGRRCGSRRWSARARRSFSNEETAATLLPRRRARAVADAGGHRRPVVGGRASSLAAASALPSSRHAGRCRRGGAEQSRARAADRRREPAPAVPRPQASPADPDAPTNAVLTRAPVEADDIEVLRGRELLIPVEGVDASRIVSNFDDNRGGASARGAGHPCAARHAGARGRGRAHRQAVYERARRAHDLSVRSDGALPLLLRAPRRVRAGLDRRPDGQPRPDDRLRRHDRQRAAGHAASALRDLQARAGEEVVGGRSARSRARAALITVHRVTRSACVARCCRHSLRRGRKRRSWWHCSIPPTRFSRRVLSGRSTAPCSPRPTVEPRDEQTPFAWTGARGSAGVDRSDRSPPTARTRCTTVSASRRTRCGDGRRSASTLHRSARAGAGTLAVVARHPAQSR